MGERLTWDLIVRDRGSAAVTTFRTRLEELKKSLDENDKKSHDFLDGVEGFAGGLQKAAAKIGVASVGLVHMAGAAKEVIGAVGSMSGALGLLPGAAAQGGVAMITLKLATHGFAAALKDTDPKKLAKDMKGLAPAAADVVKQVNLIRPGLKDLQRSVQQRTFSGLAREVAPLAKEYLPSLKSALGFVADNFNYATKGALAFLKSADTKSKIMDIVFRTSDSVAKLSVRLLPLAPAFLNIAHASTMSLQGIGSSIGGVSQKFAAFIARVTDNGAGGQFAVWVQHGVDSVKTFGTVLGQVGQLLGHVFAGASGGGGLTTLANALKAVNAEVEKPAFKAGLATFFADLQTGSDAVSASLPKVLDAVLKLGPALGTAISAGGVAFGSSLKVYAEAAILLAPSITAVVNALAPFAGILGVALPLMIGVSKAIKVWEAFTAVIEIIKGMTMAMTGLNISMDANPIGLVVIGIAALAVGFTIAYQKSETFRIIVNRVFKAIGNVILGAISAYLGAFEHLFGVLGKLPGPAGAPFRAMANAAKKAKGEVDRVHTALNRLPTSKRVTITTVYKEVRSRAGTSSSDHDSTIISGKRAGGGPVRAGQSYIVGEDRPEVFEPDQNGTIVPRVPTVTNSHTPYGASTTVYLTVVAGLSGPQQIRDAVVDAFQKTPAGSRVLPKSAIA